MSELPVCPHGCYPKESARKDESFFWTFWCDHMSFTETSREDAEEKWTRAAIALSEPMKLIIISGTQFDKCPRCGGAYISRQGYKYCPHCGQPLAW